MPARAASHKRGVLARLIDAVLPPRCPGCGAVVLAQGRFCAACWGQLRLLGEPWCAGCNLPFVLDAGPGTLCAACAAAPPRHAGVRAAVAYDAVARTLVLRLKHGGRAAYAGTAARLMARLMPADATLLVPVPLHRWRLWSRGYNQAALIATALTRLVAVPSDALLLQRHRATPMLRDRGPAARREAVAGAFRVQRPAALHDARVVLIDDVYTSGATANACAAALLDAGARSVTVLVWARVLADRAD